MGNRKHRFWWIILPIFLIIFLPTQNIIAEGEVCDPSNVFTEEGILKEACRPGGVIHFQDNSGEASDSRSRYVVEPGEEDDTNFRDQLIQWLTKRIFPLIAILSVIFLIIAGFRMATSIGQEDEFKKATNFALNVIYGFLVVVLAYGAITVILRLILEISIGAA